jgi:hypothetical protein
MLFDTRFSPVKKLHKLHLLSGPPDVLYILQWWSEINHNFAADVDQ